MVDKASQDVVAFIRQSGWIDDVSDLQAPFDSCEIDICKTTIIRCRGLFVCFPAIFLIFGPLGLH